MGWFKKRELEPDRELEEILELLTVDPIPTPPKLIPTTPESTPILILDVPEYLDEWNGFRVGDWFVACPSLEIAEHSPPMGPFYITKIERSDSFGPGEITFSYNDTGESHSDKGLHVGSDSTEGNFWIPVKCGPVPTPKEPKPKVGTYDVKRRKFVTE